MAKTEVKSTQIKQLTLLIDDLRDFGSEDGGSLNLNVKAGRIRDDNTITDKASQVVALTDNTTNFIELSIVGVASANTSAFTAGSIPIATVVTSGGSISTITDKRSWIVATPVDISARVFNSSTQSIADDTVTALTFNSERWDTDTIHDTVTNNTRLTATTAGKYLITGHVRMAANSTGFRELSIILNGTTNLARTSQNAVASPNITGLAVATHFELSSNDFVELNIFQNSGGSLSTQLVSSESPEFAMVRVP